jgi:hypothetical protein
MPRGSRKYRKLMRLVWGVYRLCGLLQFSKRSVDEMDSDCTFADG